MDVPALVDRLAAEGPLLAAAARRAGWDAPIPGLDWTVRDAVTHVGGVHRWAADVVRTGAQEFATELGGIVGTGPGDDELLKWFVGGHRELVEALRAAPADLDAFAFLPADSPLHFWARRQAHETAVHRVDVESATGAVTPLDVEFAQDGIVELLDGFAARRSNAIAREATMLLACADEGASWELVFGGPRIVAQPIAGGTAGTPDAIVRGSSSDLYLWLWNRPSGAAVSGDESVARSWAETVRVQWS